MTPGFVKKNAKGQTVNRVESVAHLGSSNVDSEECWSMAVFARSYGLVYIDHQARGLTRPHCTGSGRVVRTRRDDESLDRSPAQ